jgi:hypothetical protein
VVKEKIRAAMAKANSKALDLSLTIDENRNIYENSDIGSVRMGGPGMKQARVDDTSPKKRSCLDILQSS